MDKNEFTKRIDELHVKMLNLESDFGDIVKEFYKSHPREKGNKDSDFYQHIDRMADTFERTASDLRQMLKNPDGIQGYQVRQ